MYFTECLHRKQVEGLKNAITLQNINERRVYRHFSETTPRRASFCGSLNNYKLLTDSSGNRRFLCFKVINVDYSHGIDLNKVYAQGFYLFSNDFQYWFDENDQYELSKHNKQFALLTLEEELVLEYLTVGNNSEKVQHFTNFELRKKLSKLTGISIDKIKERSFGIALRKNGFYPKTVGNLKRYSVIFKKR